MHRDDFTTLITQLRVIDDALLQAISHTKNIADRRYGILSGILAATFLIKYCSLLCPDLNC